MRPALLLAALLATGAVHAADLSTAAERSGFVRTGRYAEVIELCDAFAARYPASVRCETFGSTPEGRPMKLLVASTNGALTAEAAKQRGLPVLLVQGGIHAGEIDGKDAGFLALRELLDGKASRGALDKQVLLFVPVFNVDGHERFAAWNRPNQRGPEEMGWRVTAQNLNLNRDYVKADAPEMRAMLRLIDAWDPVAYVDLHVTDGAKFEHDVSVQVEPVNSGDDALRAEGRAFRSAVIDRLAAQGSLPLPYYPSFVKPDDPTSGFEDGVSPPRFSTGYMTLRNRFAMLVETHSWRPYAYRVKVTHNAVLAVVDQVARNGARWLGVAHAADARAASLAGQDVPLDYAASPKSRTVAFRGYAYTRTPSAVSGALMTRYDESRPKIWNIPLRDEVRPLHHARAPGAGYVVPAAFADRVRPLLETHGLQFETLAARHTRLSVYSGDSIRFNADSVEGHQRLATTGQWRDDAVDLAPGALFVPIAQPRARLAMALFEPEAPDSLVQWGFFNPMFERKEYMEDYVAEEVAEQMLRKDPALRAEFERRVREDTAFAADPQARLEFFYRRHSAWDTHYGRYPVMRAEQPLD